MAWESDVREAVYTSPSGKKIVFDYDSKLTSEIDLKTAAFTFPSKDGALVIPLGLGGRKFSLSCYFFGSSCLAQANDFETALKEKGVGTLDHPLYGSFKVVPTGTIAREDDTVEGVGFSAIKITFAETITNSSVVSEIVKIDEINNKIEELKEKSVLDFIKDTYTKTAKAVVKLKNEYKKILKNISDTLGNIAAAERKINTAFQTAFNEIFSPLDNLVGNLDMVARQTVNLIHLPSKMAVNSLKKIESYSNSIGNIATQFRNLDPNFDNVKNQWAMTQLSLSNMIAAISGGVAESSQSEKSESAFSSREEAVEAVVQLTELYDKVIAIFERFVAENITVDTGETYEAMRDVVALSTQFILNNAFELPTKRMITLKSERQVNELVYDLYGSLDRLDEFIVDNKLKYEELEIIPAGREVSYYV